jgi:hypothetical protein
MGNQANRDIPRIGSRAVGTWKVALDAACQKPADDLKGTPGTGVPQHIAVGASALLGGLGHPARVLQGRLTRPPCLCYGPRCRACEDAPLDP